jgi:hypothetical protein
MKKIHIFDMDGTLIRSMPHIVGSILHVLEEDHIVYGPELIDTLIPLGYPKTAEIFQTMGVSGTVDEIVGRFMDLLYQAYANEITLKPGAEAYLRKLKKHENVILVDAENASAISHDVTDPAKRLIDEEAYLSLYRRIREALSEYENQVWWLYLSGRTASEIGKQLGKDARSVQNAVYRIRRKLRSVIPYS